MLPLPSSDDKKNRALRSVSTPSLLSGKKLAKKAKAPDRSASVASLTSPSTTSINSLLIPPSPGQLPLARSITPEHLVEAQSPTEEKDLDWVIPNVSQNAGSKKASSYQGPMLKLIYSDHIKHLVACARAWFGETTPDGEAIFMRLWSNCVFVIAHPGYWTPSETDLLREAMEISSLLPKAFAPGRLLFVKEPAATVFFARRHVKNAGPHWLEAGSSFALCDAAELGTSVIGYTVITLHPKLKLRAYEAVSRLPVGAGSVTRAFQTLLTKRLAKSKFKSSEHITAIMDQFESKVKHKFASNAEIYNLKFAADGVDAENYGIKNGWITLSGLEIEEAFKPTVDAILVRLSSVVPRAASKHILLSGGFGESPYLQRRLRETFEAPSGGVAVVIPEIPTHTAVSEGAARFYIAETVVPVALRYDLGVSSAVDWSSNWQRDMEREVFTSVNGDRFILGKWTPVISKGTVFEAKEPIRKVYNVKHVIGAGPPIVEVQLWAFDPATCPSAEGWMTDLKGVPYSAYENCCVVTADFSSTIMEAKRRGEADRAWVQLEFELMIYVGKATLEACIVWKDQQGGVMRGPASIIDKKFFP